MEKEPEEKPELLEMDLHVTKKYYQPTAKAEEEALMALKGALPTSMRASPARLEEFYQHGYMLYKFGRYKHAETYFHMLVLADPGNPKYLMALAACMHMQKQYLTAVQLYSTVMYFEPDNPMPLYHTADCYIKIHQPFNALIALEMAVEKCREPKHEALKDRMKLMVARLGNELTEQMRQSQDSFVGKSGKKLYLVKGKVMLD